MGWTAADSRWAFLPVVASLGLAFLAPGCGCRRITQGIDRVENQVARLASVAQELGTLVANESVSWQEVLRKLPEEYRPTVEAVIDRSLAKARAEFERAARTTVQDAVTGMLATLDYAELKVNANLERLRMSLLDAVLRIQRAELKNEKAVLELLGAVTFEVAFVAPQIKLGSPRAIRISDTRGQFVAVTVVGWGFPTPNQPAYQGWVVEFLSAETEEWTVHPNAAQRWGSYQGPYRYLLSIPVTEIPHDATKLRLRLGGGPPTAGSMFEWPIRRDQAFTCTTCKGRRYVTCKRCAGKGAVVGPDRLVGEKCAVCQGQGRLPCTRCDDNGRASDRGGEALRREEQ